MAERPMHPKDYEIYGEWCRVGAHPGIIVNKQIHLTKEQLLLVLQRIRDAIASGEPLEAVDSEDIGNKYTYCTWGLCANSSDYYPSRELHQFPKDFDERGRISALRWPEGTYCPMDSSDGQKPHWGCFYRCRVFKRKLAKPLKENALALYDKAISELKG